MSKVIVAITALLAGSATFGFLLYLQTHPRAFTGGGPAADLGASRYVEVLPVAPAEVAVSTELPGEVVQLEPVLIWGSLPSRGIIKPSAEEKIPFATVPCSKWFELGPKASTKLPGSRHYRDLCI